MNPDEPSGRRRALRPCADCASAPSRLDLASISPRSRLGRKHEEKERKEKEKEREKAAERERRIMEKRALANFGAISTAEGGLGDAHPPQKESNSTTEREDTGRGGKGAYDELKRRGGASRLPVATAHEVAQLSKVFGSFDTDGSGSIDTEELEAMLISMGKKPKPEELQQMIARADADGDGSVDFAEFVEFMGKRLPPATSAAPAAAPASAVVAGVPAAAPSAAA